MIKDNDDKQTNLQELLAMSDLGSKDVAELKFSATFSKLCIVLVLLFVIVSDFPKINLMLWGNQVEAYVVDVYTKSSNYSNGRSKRTQILGVYAYYVDDEIIRTTITLPTRKTSTKGEYEVIYVSKTNPKDITTKGVVYGNLSKSIMWLLFFAAVTILIRVRLNTHEENKAEKEKQKLAQLELEDRTFVWDNTSIVLENKLRDCVRLTDTAIIMTRLKKPSHSPRNVMCYDSKGNLVWTINPGPNIFGISAIHKHFPLEGYQFERLKYIDGNLIVIAECVEFKLDLSSGRCLLYRVLTEDEQIDDTFELINSYKDNTKDLDIKEINKRKQQHLENSLNTQYSHILNNPNTKNNFCENEFDFQVELMNIRFDEAQNDSENKSTLEDLQAQYGDFLDK